jgi:hypothetical protein
MNNLHISAPDKHMWVDMPPLPHAIGAYGIASISKSLPASQSVCNVALFSFCQSDLSIEPNKLRKWS